MRFHLVLLSPFLTQSSTRRNFCVCVCVFVIYEGALTVYGTFWLSNLSSSKMYQSVTNHCTVDNEEFINLRGKFINNYYVKFSVLLTIIL